VKVLWIDPGLKTGVCLYDAEAQEIRVSKIIPNGLAGFRQWWETFGSRYNQPGYDSSLAYDVLGCESFELEEGTHGIDYENPLAIIHYLESLGIEIEWQRRMQRGKNTVARVEVLKRAGLYPKRGELKEGHQVAALQHLLAYLMKIGHRKTIELLHPKDL
jgi:hypothetical protein